MWSTWQLILMWMGLQVTEPLTPLEDAIAFDRVASDPATNGYSSIKTIHPIIRGYISVHTKPAPWLVRFYFLFMGILPERFTKDM